MSGFYRVAQGLRLSSLGIGTYLGNADDDTDRAYEAALHAAIDGGINVIDTARNYRRERSEKAIARAIAGRNRDELILCTKAGYRIDEPGHSLDPGFLEANLHASLANLGVAQVDIFYLHNPETQSDLASLIPRAFERCEELVSRGLIRFYGAATWNGFRAKDNAMQLHDLADTARNIAGPGHRFRFVQLPFNLAMHEAFSLRNQRGGTSLLQAAGECGVTVIGSATVLQGRLTKDLPPQLAPKFPGLTTDAQRSIQFSRSAPGMTVSLVGMSNTKHVEENLAVKQVARLSEADYYSIYGK